MAMIEFLQNFHFLRPWALCFLLLPLALYLKNFGISGQLSSWENICDKKLLSFLLVNQKQHKRISIYKYLYSGILAAIIACAGPCWKKTEIPALTVENPVMFVLSLAQDMQLKDITPSRLERAKFMLSDITDNLVDGQFGIEVYSQEPYVITPISDDVKIIKNLLPQIVADIVPDQGDRLDRAIDLAVQRFKSAGYASGNIVLFASDVGQRFDLALEKIKEATDLNYTINIVDTSFSGNDKLQLMAKKGRGLYLSVKAASAQQLIKRINERNVEKMNLSKNFRSNYIDYGYWLVFVCLLCLLPFFRRGLLIVCLCYFFSFNAYAGFLQNNNQEGFSYFKKNDYDAALKKFTDFTWRGVTFYKQENLEEALKEFSKNKTDIDLYNKGVVLTKQCKYQEAFDAFSQALALNPQNEDAQYNKGVLFDLLEKAKDDSSLLNCDNNQNEQNNKNESEQDNQSAEDSSSNQGNQQQDNNEENSQENNSDNNQEQKQENSSSEENSDNNENSQDNSQQNEQNGGEQQDSYNQNQDNNSPGQEDNSNNDSEKNNTPSKANNDQGEENNSENTEGDDNNGSQTQKEEMEAQVMGAKQGDDNTTYDEEALALQHRYREIPEDVGGLLRQFIRKEYMKDRYHDEK